MIAVTDMECDFCSERPVVAIHGVRYAPGLPIRYDSPHGWAACVSCHEMIDGGAVKRLELRCTAVLAQKWAIDVFGFRRYVRQMHQRYWGFAAGTSIPAPSDP